MVNEEEAAQVDNLTCVIYFAEFAVEQMSKGVLGHVLNQLEKVLLNPWFGQNLRTYKAHHEAIQ
jgi:hypothetical protein